MSTTVQRIYKTKDVDMLIAAATFIVMFYNVLEKTIMTISANNSNEMKVAVSNLSKGVYLVEITTQSDLKITKKLVIN